tara:strand:- start:3674 stop:4447 length:774 start_codon:yes stop_codon:yes gene_type:complete
MFNEVHDMSKSKESKIKQSMAIYENEKEQAHRAFLLFAMQAPNKRSQRAVAKAVGCSAPSIGEWKKRFEWEERIKEAGPAHDSIAQKTYNELYFKKNGMREIAVIEKRILAPISVVGTTSRPIGEQVIKTVEQSVSTVKENKESTLFDDQMKARHLDLVDRSIQYISDCLQTGDVKVTLRDLPVMLDLRDHLTGKVKEDEATGGSIVIETIRVKDAKKSGGDLIQAMLEDSKELVAIFESLSLQGKYNPKEDINAGE